MAVVVWTPSVTVTDHLFKRCVLSWGWKDGVALPVWPSEVQWESLAPEYSDSPRPGRTPLLLRESEALARARISTVVGDVNPDDSTTAWKTLGKLRQMAAWRKPLTFWLGETNYQPFVISEFSFTELDWDAAGRCSRAEVSLTLTEMSVESVPMGPVKRKRRPHRPRREEPAE